jgi:hypothetical protein
LDILGRDSSGRVNREWGNRGGIISRLTKERGIIEMGNNRVGKNIEKENRRKILEARDNRGRDKSERN